MRRRSTHLFAWPLATALATVGMATAASADPSAAPVDLDAPDALRATDPSMAIAEAAQRAAIAQSQYDSQNWAEARAEFIRAFELHPHPRFLFYIADTHRQQGSLRTALMYYHRFLESSATDHELRSEAERHTRQLHSAIGDQAVATGSFRPNGSPDLVLRPGSGPRPWSPAKESSDPDRGAKIGFAVAGGLTAASAVFWGFSGARVLHFQDDKDAALEEAARRGVLFDAADACADAASRSGPDAERVDTACDDGQRWAFISNTALAATVVGAITTGYFGYKAYISPSSDREKVRLTVSPSVSSTGVGVTGALAF